MNNLINWFFELPIPNALGLVAMVGLLAGCVAIIITDKLVSLVVQHRIAGVDEFADKDDAFALLHDVSYRDAEYFRQIDMKSFTCSTCSEQRWCAFAFDMYNTDGDCLAAK